MCCAQLGRFEQRRAELERKGASLAAVCVDPLERSQALAKRLALGYPILTDPGGATVKAWGLWHAARGISLPAVVVVGADGRVAWRKIGETITDRPSEEEVLAAVDRLR